MNLTDFLIIYLACGAPFGVYYFLKHRREKMLRLKTLFNFVFWMPFAFTLLRRNLRFRNPFFKTDSEFSGNEAKKNLDAISKRIESILLESDLEISIYEFRETVERYVGLTLAAKSDAAIAEHEKEIFRAAARKSTELGARCLHRRNRKRLSFHQIEARAGFLSLIAQLAKSAADRVELGDLSIEFAEILGDQITRQSLEKMFAASQTDERRSVVKLEKDLWKPPTRRPQTAKQISRLQTLKATAGSRSED